MLLEILNITCLEKNYVAGNFKNISTNMLPHTFKNIWINITWLEEKYLIRGFQNYLNKQNLITRSRCYAGFLKIKLD